MAYTVKRLHLGFLTGFHYQGKVIESRFKNDFAVELVAGITTEDYLHYFGKFYVRISGPVRTKRNNPDIYEIFDNPEILYSMTSINDNYCIGGIIKLVNIWKTSMNQEMIEKDAVSILNIPDSPYVYSSKSKEGNSNEN